jgi:serine/threonine-protein phosphatase 2A regulatory subunit B'
MEYDLVLYDKCTAAFFRQEEEAKNKLAAIETRWKQIEEIASTSEPSIMVK